MKLTYILPFAGALVAQGKPTPHGWATKEWDAIIVGAGTAGIIVADRLSEAGLRTLVIEQGVESYGITGGRERPDWLNGTELSRVDVPGLYKSIFSGGSSLLCKPSEVSTFQACAIGGNSAINAGLYFQPPSSDWDTYFPDGWHSQDVQPGIERLLHRQPPVTSYSSNGQYYLQSGYEAVKDWIVGSANYTEVAVDETPDNKDRVFGRPVYNYINGQRGGPVRTYLQSALSRSNFHLQIGVKVNYIQQKNGEATGVVVTSRKGKTKTVNLATNGRVILSAGAILSPQILMYSGIGPQDQLQQLAAANYTPYNNSTWIVQPDVGKGLFDNPNTFIELSAPSVTSYTYSYGDPPPADQSLFLQNRSGPYTFASQTSVFWRYMNNKDGTKTGVQGTVDSSGYSDYTNGNTITLNVYGTSGLLSSGQVILSTDGNFTAMPNSDVYYSNPRDAHSIARFIHSLFKGLPSSTPESPASSGLTPLNIPQNSTVKQIREYITTPSAYAVGSVNHWSSSCRIGTCVDNNTTLIGTENIHVIDASILAPMTVNPQFAVMVAGEVGSERVLKLFGKS